MSDTSVVPYGSGQYDGFNAENNPYQRKNSCWTRKGANICVGILIIVTIILASTLGYFLYERRVTMNMLTANDKHENRRGKALTGSFGFNSLIKSAGDMISNYNQEDDSGDTYE